MIIRYGLLQQNSKETINLIRALHFPPMPHLAVRIRVFYDLVAI